MTSLSGIYFQIQYSRNNFKKTYTAPLHSSSSPPVLEEIKIALVSKIMTQSIVRALYLVKDTSHEVLDMTESS